MKMHATIRLSALALLTCLTGTSTAYAADLAVSATVPTSCLTLANSTLVFGNYSGAQLDVDTSVSVTCTNGTDYHVRMNMGVYGTSVSDRKMEIDTAATDTLNYALYRDAGHTQNWGETDTTDTYDDMGTGGAQTITVHGRIPAAQTPPVGNYSDTVTVTLVY